MTQNKTALFFTIICAITMIQSPRAAAQKLLFDPPRGFYESAFDLTITSPVDGAVIKYTFNGEDPLTSSTAQSQPSPATVRIDPTHVANRDWAPGVCVRAIAVFADTAVTNMGTHTFMFVNKIGEMSRDNRRPGAAWPNPGNSVNGQFMNYGMDAQILNDSRYKDKISAAMLDVPSMSMVLDLDDMFDPTDGIYVNATEDGIEWERPASLELLNPDGSDGFHINCGVRIRGGWSRNGSNPKHAFRFFFRREYGEAKLNHPLFEDEGTDQFDKFDLRCTQNYAWSFYGDEKNTFLRDVFSRDLQRDMGSPYTRSRYYHFYINGTYWGLFQTQERSEASFAESYFGGNREDYDVIKVDAGYPDSQGNHPYTIEATDGTLDAYYSLWDICEEGFENIENYYRVQGLNVDGSLNPNYAKLVDLENLIDFMINTMFVGDFDSPVSDFSGNQNPNNFYAIYNRVNPQGFLHFRHDAEHSLGVQGERGSDRTGPFPAGQQREKFNPQWLHQKLSENPEYRIQFSDRVYKHFFNNGVLTEEANINRWLARKAEIDLAIIGESARWGDAKTNPARTRDDDWLPQVEWVVDNHFPERNDIVLNQFISKGWYQNFQPPEFNTQGGKVDKGFQARLSAADGEIYYTINDVDPHNPLANGGLRNVPIFSWPADKRAIVPQENISTEWRTDASFDDSDWHLCSGAPGGIGYERNDGYQSWVTLDVGEYMREDESADANSSCFIRIPFSVDADDLAKFAQLSLRLRFDDGFRAYLNGVNIAEFNVPENLTWNSLATENHEADGVNTFDVTNFIGTLQSGENLLAIHALNVSLTSSDFIIMAELVGGIVEQSGDLVAAEAVKYPAPIIISKTTHVKARVLKGGLWSALNEATFVVEEDMSGLRLTELHYNPIPEGEGETKIDGDLFEFLELKNLRAEEINLTGVRWIKGVKYDFPPAETIQPGGFYVLCSSAEHFKMRYGFDPDGQYIGNLSNGGERIVLTDALGDTLLNVKYNDKAPWPIEADSTGQSLVSTLARPHGNPDDPGYWIASAGIHGSPNADDLASPVQNENILAPVQFQLRQNYPNPFNPITTIRFETPHEAEVDIAIFNTLGQRVQTLLDEKLSAGAHSVHWNGSSHAGGLYFCQMQAGDYKHTIKLLLIK